MKNLIVKGDFKHPEIAFDAKSGILELIGKSIPERAGDFYTPIIEWLKNYLQSPHETTTLNLKLIYLNSTSKRYLLNLLELLKSNKNNITINWYYEEDDEDMLDLGKSYKEVVDLPINFIPVKKI